MLYDPENTPLLFAEKAKLNNEGQRTNAVAIKDGRGQAVAVVGRRRDWIEDASGRRISRIKMPTFRPRLQAITDATKREVGSFKFERPTLREALTECATTLTLTAAATPELRLAALGYATSLTDSVYRTRTGLFELSSQAERAIRTETLRCSTAPNEPHQRAPRGAIDSRRSRGPTRAQNQSHLQLVERQPQFLAMPGLLAAPARPLILWRVGCWPRGSSRPTVVVAQA